MVSKAWQGWVRRGLAGLGAARHGMVMYGRGLPQLSLGRARPFLFRGAEPVCQHAGACLTRLKPAKRLHSTYAPSTPSRAHHVSH